MQTFEHEAFAEIIADIIVSAYTTVYLLARGLGHGWATPRFILDDFDVDGAEDRDAYRRAAEERAEAAVVAIRSPEDWTAFVAAVDGRMRAAEHESPNDMFGEGLRPALAHESHTGRYRWRVEGADVVVEIWRPVDTRRSYWGTRTATSAGAVLRARIRSGRVVALTAAGGAEGRHIGYLRDWLAAVAPLPGAPVAPIRRSGGWDETTAAAHEAHEAAMRAFCAACDAWAATVPRGDTYTIGRPVPVPQPEVRDYSDAVILRPQESADEAAW
jgi:hypothetical protein